MAFLETVQQRPLRHIRTAAEGNKTAASFETLDEQSFQKVWFVAHESYLVIATYNSIAEDWEIEISEVEGIVGSSKLDPNFQTGLDFSLRVTTDQQWGAFTSVDPLLSSGTVESPQSWNRYSYVLNNPLKLIDPCVWYRAVPQALFSIDPGSAQCHKPPSE